MKYKFVYECIILYIYTIFYIIIFYSRVICRHPSVKVETMPYHYPQYIFFCGICSFVNHMQACL